MKKNNRKNLKKTQARGRTRQTSAEQYDSRSGEVSYVLPRSRRVIADRLVSNLRWTDETHTNINQAGLNYATIRYRPTGTFDIDPTLGGTAVPGFAELASLYGKYRVLSSSIRVEFANRESSTMRCFVWPSNFDLGNNYVNLVAAIDAPFAKHKLISSRSGIDTCSLTIRNLESGKVIGSDAAYVDDDYSAAPTTVPVNNWYWNVGIWSPTAVLVNGADMLVSIDMVVEFTERLILVN